MPFFSYLFQNFIIRHQHAFGHSAAILALIFLIKSSQQLIQRYIDMLMFVIMMAYSIYTNLPFPKVFLYKTIILPLRSIIQQLKQYFLCITPLHFPHKSSKPLLCFLLPFFLFFPRFFQFSDILLCPVGNAVKYTATMCLHTTCFPAA